MLGILVFAVLVFASNPVVFGILLGVCVLSAIISGYLMYKYDKELSGLYRTEGQIAAAIQEENDKR
jgi:hypothetical protein